MRAFVFLCLFVLVLPRALGQNVWYVDVNGTPPGTGTQANPYTSLQYAHNQATKGDIVLVAPGLYSERVFDWKGLTFLSTDGPEATIVEASSGSIFRAFEDTVIEGFTISGASGFTTGVWVPSTFFPIDRVTVRRCIVRDCRTAFVVDTCGSLKVEESTIVDNGELLCHDPFEAYFEMKNSILWGNNILFVWGCTGTISYTAGQSSGCLVGPGNIAVDPMFWDHANDDLRLKPGSPCIDAGDPSSPRDPDGSRIDIGALTYDPTYAPAPDTYCTGKTNSAGCVPEHSLSGQRDRQRGEPIPRHSSRRSPQQGRAAPLQHGWKCGLPIPGWIPLPIAVHPEDAATELGKPGATPMHGDLRVRLQRVHPKRGQPDAGGRTVRLRPVLVPRRPVRRRIR